MQRYTQDNVPEDVVNRFPQFRSKSISRNPSPAPQEKQQDIQAVDNNVPEEIKKKFPQFTNVKNFKVLDKDKCMSVNPLLSQLKHNVPMQIGSQNMSIKPLGVYQFAPPSLPVKAQCALNQNKCTLCPPDRKFLGGPNDLPICHKSPRIPEI